VDQQHWKQIGELFAAARILDGEAQVHFLKEKCASDTKLFGEVKSLLDAEAPTGPLDRDQSTFRAAAIALPAEKVIAGRFRIIRFIAEGGMGAVYETILSGPLDDRFRVIERNVGSGKPPARKDPVFERLRERDHFPTKLHELPLYILGKSLLMDNEPLYGQARNLYATRNHLAHSGEIDESSSKDLYSVDQVGSGKALSTTKGVFAWLGVDHGITLPKLDFVRVDELKARLGKS
jgi:hypothetical protein